MPGPKLIRPPAVAQKSAVAGSDDWTDDPSFDFPLDSQGLNLPLSPPSFFLPSSSSSSSSPKSSRSRKNTEDQRHHGSPVRPSTSGTIKASRGKQPMKQLAAEFGDDADFNCFDPVPDFDTTRFGTIRLNAPRSESAASSTRSSLRHTPLPQTVVGHGPKGVGTITRLGSGTQAPLPPTNMKAAAKAMEVAWEEDVDYGDLEPAPRPSASKATHGARLTLSPRRQPRVMPDADALDNLGFDFDDNEATLKAGNTLKAMLPPPRQKSKAPAKAAQDEDFEGDLVLPLNMQNLALIPPAPKLKTRPRVSNASTLNTDWDSPTASTSGHKSIGGGFSWSGESGKGGKGMSDTSATSVSVATPSTSKRWDRETDHVEVVDDEEDMESGLVLPSETFFSDKRAKELNSILDRKRRQEYAPAADPVRPSGRGDRHRQADESMEDGLLLDDPKMELSKSRLRHQKRSRHANNTGTYPPKGQRGDAGPSASRPTEAHDDEGDTWQKDRERGWGRHTPVQATIKDRSHPSGATTSGNRSHSASAGMTLNAFAPATPARYRDMTIRDVSHPTPRTQSRAQAVSSTPLPPVPATPATGSRLRHQKSYHHLSTNSAQSPSLPKKQSLASLRDAFARPTENDPTISPPSTIKHHNTASRLTMPTSASRAKAKPPISQIFPEYYGGGLNAAAGPSSATPTPSISRVAKQPQRTATRLMDQPRNARVYGDGSELDGIDDLSVDQGTSRAGPIGLGRPSRPGAALPPKSAVRPAEPDKKKVSGSGAGSVKRRTRKPAMLIKHLGAVEKRKVVGEMTWNPDTLRWEGNEGVLRDFDSIPTSESAQPALITHLGGSSGMSPGSASSSAAGLAGTVKIVGDMRFDPEKMCWVSLGDEEPDPFEGMADDEDDGTDYGATITRASGRKLMAVGLSSSSSFASASISASAWSSSRLASESSNFSAAAASSVASEGWEERVRVDVPKELVAECKEAEERHKREMKGWIIRSGSRLKEGAALSKEDARDRDRREEKRLWEIRNLALRS